MKKTISYVDSLFLIGKNYKGLIASIESEAMRFEILVSD